MTTAAAPPQNMEALALANTVRIEGAAHRRELRALARRDAFLKAAELLEDPPPSVQRMKVGHLLTGIHRVGEVESAKILKRSGIYDRVPQIGPQYRDLRKRRVLSERQRLALAGELRRRAAR